MENYFTSVKSFYRRMYQIVFATERQLDGPLSEFIPREGFFWDLLESHKWAALAGLNFFLKLLQLFVGYGAMAILAVGLVLSPLALLVMYPIFMWRNRREISQRGEQL